MSTYETLSITVSIIALAVSIAVPLIGAVRKKLSRPKLSILPFDYQPLSLQFNQNLSWISFNFSILCEKAPCVASSIDAVVTRLSDESELQLRWSWLQPLWSSWATGNGLFASLNSATAAKPVRLQAETLEPLLVNFESKDLRTLSRYQLEQQVFDGITDTRPGTLQEEDYFITSMKQSTGCLDVCKSAQKGFFWLSGDYVLTLSVRYDAGREHAQSFSFSVSAAEESRLRGNLDHIVFRNMCPLHFSNCSYQAVFKDVANA